MDEELGLFKTDWQRFKKEMNARRRGRVTTRPAQVTQRHDRYIVGSDTVWNIPPVNSLHKATTRRPSRRPTARRSTAGGRRGRRSSRHGCDNGGRAAAGWLGSYAPPAGSRCAQGSVQTNRFRP